MPLHFLTILNNYPSSSNIEFVRFVRFVRFAQFTGFVSAVSSWIRWQSYNLSTNYQTIFEK